MVPSSLSRLLILALSAVGSSASLADYAPDRTACPDIRFVRTFPPSKQTLNPSESLFIEDREQRIIPQNWQTWIGDGSSIGYKFSELAGHFPRVGLAFSGGGYRASQFEAGVISAIDGRNVSAVAAGTGGLLQVASYLSGLSGGSWLTGALYMNNFPTVQDMVLGSQPGWLMQNDLFLPGGSDFTAPENLEYFNAIGQSVDAKAAAGFNVTLGDTWARALSYHFLSGTTLDNFFDTSSHGAGQLWSNISRATFFVEKQAPFPLVVFDTNGTFDVTTETTSLNLNVWEISPFEFASFDPDVSAGADLTYIGTSLFEGVPINKSSCVVGFDQAGFVMGTSSNIFYGALEEGEGAIIELLLDILGAPLDEETLANVVVSKWPNPFRGIAPSTFVDSSSAELELIDGGTNGENLPLNPLLVKARAVDVIVAVDASDDTNNSWPSGFSLLATTQRTSQFLKDTHQKLPEIPSSPADFVAQGLNQRPTFFGCDCIDTDTDAPLVIYIPNSPPLNGDAPFTNPTTLQTSFQPNDTQIFLNQAFENTIGGFVPNTNLPDPNWGRCLQCAVVDRARTPAVERSKFCTSCFTQYCYNPHNLTSDAELPNRQLVYAGPPATSLPI